MKNIIFTFLLALLHLLQLNVLAQIGIGTTTPHASSILELSATNKGFLVPRMTQAQRTSIASPATGLLVYQTNGTPGFYYYNGSDWSLISTSSGDNLGNHIATQNIRLNGNWLSGDGGSEGVYVNNSGNVGIGTNNPIYKLDVRSNFNKTHGSYHNVFHVGSNDVESMGLFVGWQGGSNKFVSMDAAETDASYIPLCMQANADTNAKIGFGTTSFVGSPVRKFQFGSGSTYNPTIIMNGPSTTGAFGIEFYENETFRSSLGYSPVAGQNWFFIYGAGGSNILRSKNGYTAIGEVGTAQFHSTLETTGSFAAPITKINVNTTLDHTHFIVYRTGGNITLPAASSCKNRMYIIVNRNNLTANISSYTDLDGTSSTTILPNSSITLVSDGTNWLRVQ